MYISAFLVVSSIHAKQQPLSSFAARSQRPISRKDAHAISLFTGILLELSTLGKWCAMKFERRLRNFPVHWPLGILIRHDTSFNLHPPQPYSVQLQLCILLYLHAESCVALSPNGNRVMTGAYGGVVRIWKLCFSMKMFKVDWKKDVLVVAEGRGVEIRRLEKKRVRIERAFAHAIPLLKSFFIFFSGDNIHASFLHVSVISQK